jgi:glycosyltransferase involved in cell wall biosynthesis
MHRYRGIVPRQEVADLRECSPLGVVTFPPTVSHINALPNKLFEYMAAAIPVVASDLPQWREIVTTSGAGSCVDRTGT